MPLETATNQVVFHLTSREYRQFYATGIWLVLFCFAQTGCTTYSHTQLVGQGRISSDRLGTAHFQHRLFENTTGNQAQSELHVYIEGDGRPWLTRYLVARDPTSTDALMLRAMQRDGHESVYLGRPCYYRLADPNCGARWWTHDRYHSRVVDSMVKAVEQVAEGREDLWLIGHSGGGSLAVLIGRRLSRPVKVLTVSGNLDHRAWTEHHHYSPLAGSLNPIEDSARNSMMNELHWYGADDKTILPDWTRDYCQRFDSRCIAADAAHTTGWLEQWDRILERSRQLFTRQATSNQE